MDTIRLATEALIRLFQSEIDPHTLLVAPMMCSKPPMCRRCCCRGRRRWRMRDGARWCALMR